MFVRAVCVDDTKKPLQIPIDKWVKKDKLYHITYIYWMVKQNFKGCDLKEIDLTGYDPYNCFRLSRFAIVQEDIPLFKEMLKTCTELNAFDIDKLIESLELVPQEVLID